MKNPPPIHESHPPKEPCRATGPRDNGEGRPRRQRRTGFGDRPPEDPRREPAGTKIGRWPTRQAQNAERAIGITPAQSAFLTKLTPCRRERHVGSGTPGERQSTDTFLVGSLRGVGQFCLPAVVDSRGSHASGLPHTSPGSPRVRRMPPPVRGNRRRWRCRPGAVRPFPRNPDRTVKAVLTDNGRAFCGADRQPDQLCPDLKGTAHRRTKVKSPPTSGLRRVQMRESRLSRPSRRSGPISTPGSSTPPRTPHPRLRNPGPRRTGTVPSCVSQDGQVDIRPALRLSLSYLRELVHHGVIVPGAA